MIKKTLINVAIYPFISVFFIISYQYLTAKSISCTECAYAIYLVIDVVFFIHIFVVHEHPLAVEAHCHVHIVVIIVLTSSLKNVHFVIG